MQQKMAQRRPLSKSAMILSVTEEWPQKEHSGSIPLQKANFKLSLSLTDHHENSKHCEISEDKIVEASLKYAKY